MDYRAIVERTLQIEANALIEAKERLGEEIERAVELIFASEGKVIVTGVGKSGHIGAKMAATFASTGTPSFFIHPTEALHGDLGMIEHEDVVIAISYSGESEELSSLLPHVKRFNVPLIGMSGNANSTLAKQSDVVVNIEVGREACPLQIAPTASTTLTLAMGDALAICLMEKRSFKKEDFASFHPGGSLGRRLFVTVGDLMQRDNIPTIDESVSIKDAVVVMSQGRLGSLLLIDKSGRLSALVSDGDIRRALMEENFSIDAPIKEYANLTPKVIEDESMLAYDALALIEKHKIQLLIVANEHREVKGVLHIHQLVEAGIERAGVD